MSRRAAISRAKRIPVQMPCGWVRTGKMAEHLAHYRQCEHPACKARLEAWEQLRRDMRGKITLTTKESSK